MIFVISIHEPIHAKTCHTKNFVIVSIRQDLSSPTDAAAAASAVASSPVSASCRHTFGIYHKSTESCFLAESTLFPNTESYVLTPIQMHYAVSDVVLQQETHV